MKLIHSFHTEAETEFETAANWYEDQQRGLGDDFVELVEEAIGRILEWPQSAPIFFKRDRGPIVRTQAVSRFPYRVIYYRTTREIVILAVAHNNRKPGYWQPRLEV